MQFGKYKPKKTVKMYDGVGYIFKFKNGCGADVVRHKYSYGGDRGLWELAVLNKKGELCYTTPITKDVEGYLTEKNVTKLLTRIERLKSKKCKCGR